MAERIAFVISIVFHPLLVFYYLILSLILTHNVVAVPINSHTIVLLLWIFVIAVLIPTLAIFVIQRDLLMKDRRKRSFSILIMSVIYVIMFFSLRSYSIPSILLRFIGGISIGLIATALINIFFKISLHTLMMGAVMLFYYKLSIINYDFFFTTLLMVVFLAGVTGSARLYLKAHRASEVYSGYLAGILLMWFFL